MTHDYSIEYVQDESGMYSWVKKDSSGNVVKVSDSSFATQAEAEADFAAHKAAYKARKAAEGDK